MKGKGDFILILMNDLIDLGVLFGVFFFSLFLIIIFLWSFQKG